MYESLTISFISGGGLLVIFTFLIIVIIITTFVSIHMKRKLAETLKPLFSEIDDLLNELDLCLASDSPLTAKAAKLNSRLPNLRTRVIYVASLQKSPRTKRYRARLDTLQQRYLEINGQVEALVSSQDKLRPILD